MPSHSLLLNQNGEVTGNRLVDALVCVQFWAKAGFATNNRPARSLMSEAVEAISSGLRQNKLIPQVCKTQGRCARHIHPVGSLQIGVLLQGEIQRGHGPGENDVAAKRGNAQGGSQRGIRSVDPATEDNCDESGAIGR